MAIFGKAKATRDEIVAAEKAVDDRVNHRNQGFRYMRRRDKGWGVLSNGVRMLWHVEEPELPDLEDGQVFVYPAGCAIPEGHFELVIDGKRVLFDAEDFRQFLRWA